MKRIVIWLMALSIIFAAFPALADYQGDMEVVNCEEWVSLRESPGIAAKRLVKVSLGAVVNNCRQFNDDWIYAEYDGFGGYILAQYLQPYVEEETIFHSAMMITLYPNDAPFYATMDSTEPIDFIPANTIVRNCIIMDNNRVYVEWGSRCGFIELLHAEVYSEMLHFPAQIALRVNPFGGEDEDGPTPPLKAVYASDFPIKEYEEHASYEYADYMEADDPELPKVTFVLYTDAAIQHVHLFSISMSSWDEATGDKIYDAVLENIQHQMDPDHPLHVGAVIWGDMPNLAVGYLDGEGVYHFAFIEISGEEGSLILREF